MNKPKEKAVESLAARLHEIYQREAERQGDKRHPDSYADLPERIKNYDRALARWILAYFNPKTPYPSN